MLATFSRRAAAELNRRVERLLRRDLGAEAAAAATPAYAGTFHAIGARLLREYADAPRARSANSPSTIARIRADLMNWTRHGAGLSRQPDAVSRPRRPASRSIRASVNARAALARDARPAFSLGGGARGGAARLFAAYVEAKQAQSVLDYDDLLLYFAQVLAEPELAAEIAGALRPSAGRRVSGHQLAAGRDRAEAAARRARPHRGRRRRAVDLFVPRRDGAQHSRLSRKLSIRRPAS